MENTLKEIVISTWNSTKRIYEDKIIQRETKFYTKEELADTKIKIDALLNSGLRYTKKDDGIYHKGELVFKPKYKGGFPSKFSNEYKKELK